MVNSTTPTQYEFLNLDAVLLTVFMLFLLIFIVFLYIKLRVWILIFTVFGFNIIFAMISLDVALPLKPYFQIFFMLISGLVFLLTSLEAWKKK